MKNLGLLLLVGFTASVPTTSSEYESISDKLISTIAERPPINVTEQLFFEKFKKYTSKHDIVNILMPRNALNIGVDSEGNLNFVEDTILFFVQGDYKEDGTFDNKGLFILKTETGEATKLLENGADFTAKPDSNSNKVYFGATDGIYVYNAVKNTAEKYGSVTDNIISIAIALDEGNDVIYALTANNELYKVTENGKKVVRVKDVKNAQQIVLDDYNHIFFYDDKKHVYVFSDSFPKEGVRYLSDLPENPKKITLLRPFLGTDNSTIVVIDDKAYVARAEGIGENTPVHLKVQPTAYSLESMLVQFCAYKKSIYKYKLMPPLKLPLDTPNELEKYIEYMTALIQQRSIHIPNPNKLVK